MEDKNKQISSRSSSLSGKKLDDENLNFIKSVMESDAKFAETGNTMKRKKQENLKAKHKPKKRPSKPQNRTNLQYDDLDNMNEENLKSYSYRARRNRFIIIVLAILLLLSITVITLYVSFMKLNPNCFLYVHGRANAEYVLDNSKLSEFRTTSAIRGFSIFLFSKKEATNTITDDRYLKMKISSSGSYIIYFKIDVYQNNEKLENSFAYELGELFKPDGDRYISKEPIEGNQTINLCLGVVMEDLEYKDTLNVNNVKIEVHTYFQRV